LTVLTMLHHSDMGNPMHTLGGALLHAHKRLHYVLIAHQAV